MLSNVQVEELKKVADILIKMAKSNDESERGVLAATGELHLNRVITENLNQTLIDMIDVPDFLN